MNTLLRDKTRRFLDASGINKTDFSKRIGMSTTTLNAWLRDDRIISVNLENRIADFIASYVIKLVEIAK